MSSSGMPYLAENALTTQMWKSATCLNNTWRDAAYASRPVVIVPGMYGMECPFFKMNAGSCVVCVILPHLPHLHQLIII